MSALKITKAEVEALLIQHKTVKAVADHLGKDYTSFRKRCYRIGVRNPTPEYSRLKQSPK